VDGLKGFPKEIGWIPTCWSHSLRHIWIFQLLVQTTQHNTFVKANLTETSMESQFLLFISILIQDVANFKSFIKRYVEELVGVNKIHILKILCGQQ
jgi:hypothetical protein